MGCKSSKTDSPVKPSSPPKGNNSLRSNNNSVVNPYDDAAAAVDAKGRTSSGAAASSSKRSTATPKTPKTPKTPRADGKLKRTASSSSLGSVSSAAVGGGLTAKELSRIVIKRNRELGRGGYGTVYLAVDKKTQEPYAVKEVVFDSKNLGMVKALRGEFEMLSQLRHPHIVQVYNYVVDEKSNSARIIMEYMANGSVRSMTKRLGGSLDEASARKVMYQAILGLHYLHMKGIIHRDTKPDNLLVDSEGTVKLSDFGTCKETMHAASGTTTHVVGTVCYMSPESISGRYYQQSDIWSLAATFVELVSGRMPWGELEVKQSIHLLFHIGSAKPPYHHPAFPSFLSLEAQGMLLDCFQYDPRQRPTTGQLLAHRYFVGGMDSEIPRAEEVGSDDGSDDSFMSLPPDAVPEAHFGP